MKDCGSDPVVGCLHGSSIDPDLRGLTKFEWFMSCAMMGYRDAYPVPEKMVDWAYQCAEIAVKRLSQSGVVKAGVDVD